MSHCHHDHHHHAPTQFNHAFLLAVVANGGYVVVQAVYAYLANSTSLLADAGHNLGDVLSLLFAWVAYRLMQRHGSEKRTYGLKKTSILAAMVNGLVLIFTCGVIVTEAVHQFIALEPVAAVDVMVVAAIGIAINGGTALLFMKGQSDLNIKAAFLHLAYDALLSFGVVIGGAVIYFTDWNWLDPVVGIVIALVILRGTWSLFRDSFNLLLDAVPPSVSLQAVRETLLNIKGVKAVHDLHIWALSTQENALSVHLVMPEQPLTDVQRREVVAQLQQNHHIHHVTIQVEQIERYCNLVDCQ